MSDIFVNKNYIPYIGSTPLNTKQVPNRGTGLNDEQSFDNVLKQKINENSQSIVFSKHATQRLSDRDIQMTPQLINTLSGAVSRAEEKGIKNALIMGQETSFIVNIPSKTVVTTLSNQNMKENVITNIDGTVII